MPYSTLADFQTNRDQFLQNQPDTGMDFFDSIFAGNPQQLTQNATNESAWEQSLAPADLMKYQGLVQQDMESGFGGAMRKYVSPLAKIAALSPLAIGAAGATGLLGGAAGFGGEAASAIGPANSFGAASFSNPAYVSLPGAAGAEAATAGALGSGAAGAAYANPAFVSLPEVPSGMLGGVYNNPAYTAIPGLEGGNISASGVASTAGAGGGDSVQDFFKNLSGQVKEKPMSSILSGARAVSSLGDLWSTYQQNQDYQNLAGNMMGLFGDDSAYAKQLRKELQRRDAASGRRSQYGPRSVELQARLAELASRQSGTLANIYQQQGANRDNMVKGGLNFMKGTGAMDWLDGQLKAPLAKLFGG